MLTVKNVQTTQSLTHLAKERVGPWIAHMNSATADHFARMNQHVTRVEATPTKRNGSGGRTQSHAPRPKNNPANSSTLNHSSICRTLQTDSTTLLRLSEHATHDPRFPRYEQRLPTRTKRWLTRPPRSTSACNRNRSRGTVTSSVPSADEIHT